MIDTQGLRKKILDLAVHGQLVQQLPEYGNAREDFEAWTKATTNKKKLIDGVEPYNIPSNWAWLTVENVIVKSVGGGTPSKNISEYWKDGNIPWASVKDFSDAKNGYLMDTRDHITKEGLENSAANMVDEEAIVICMRMALGKVARVRRPMAINQDLRAIWLSPLVDKDYFVGFYSTLKVEGTGTTVAGIKKDQLFKTPFPLPPISEQHRIVKRMRAAFEMIDFIDSLQQQYTNNITSLNKKILDLAVMGKLVPQDPNDEPANVLLKKIAEEKQKLIKEGKIKKQKALPVITEDEIPFDIPKSWEWVRWGTIAQSIQYGFNAPAQETGRIKMVRISDIQNNQVQWETVPYCEIDEKEISNYLLEENDILFARTGGTVGKSFLVKSVEQEAIYAGYLIRTRYSQRLCPDYLKLFMESDLYWRQLRNGTIATAQPNCNGQTLSKMLIPIPPAEEQNRIASEVQKYSLSVKELHAKAN